MYDIKIKDISINSWKNNYLERAIQKRSHEPMQKNKQKE